jgi:small-conductance mechanosensitive channel
VDGLRSALLEAWDERVIQQAGDLLVRLGLALLAALLMLAIARLTLGAARRALGRTRAHANARLLVDRLVQFAFIVLAGAWALSILGIEVTALVALFGAGALAVSLALQDVLKNLVAGLYILVERPFTIGEQIDFKTFSGTVETIELRTTALRTPSGQRVVIPNAMLFAEALVNRSAYGRQLLRLRVTLPAAQASRDVTGELLAAIGGDQATGRAADTVVTRQIPQAGGASGAGTVLATTAGTGGSTDGEPRVLVESLTAEKVVLRAEVWVPDARDAAPELAWAVRERLPQADVAVLE